jgi:hypothetical protein
MHTRSRQHGRSLGIGRMTSAHPIRPNTPAPGFTISVAVSSIFMSKQKVSTSIKPLGDADASPRTCLSRLGDF